MRWIRSSYSSFAPRVEHGFWALHGMMLLGLLAWVLLSWSSIAHSVTTASIVIVSGYLLATTGAYVFTRTGVIGFNPVFWPILAVDLFIVGWIVQLSGGMTSNFYLLFFALVPFVAFYHGLRVGMVAAAIVSVKCHRGRRLDSSRFLVGQGP